MVKMIDLLIFEYFSTEDDNSIYNEEYVIDVNQEVHMPMSVVMVKRSTNGKIPVKFAHVDGDFDIRACGLTSLEGSPHSLTGDFMCSNNRLESLEHAPKKIDPTASFYCHRNRISSLTHAPAGGSLYFEHNKLTTLNHAPACDYLSALYNPLQNLAHTPDHINKLVISYAPDLPLLGLLNVKEIELRDSFTNTLTPLVVEINKILNAHTRQGRAGQIQCAAELIRAGHKSNAWL